VGIQSDTRHVTKAVCSKTFP